MEQLYFLFTLFVTVSFLWFGKGWLADFRRWHIGWLSFSYTVFTWRILLQLYGLDIWLYDYLFALGVIAGILGLGQYWVADLRLAYLWWGLYNEQRKSSRRGQ